MPNKKYLTHQDMNQMYIRVLQQMAQSKYHPDVIVAPMRGGADMGVKFSNWFNVPVIAIQWQTRDGDEQHRDYLHQALSAWHDHPECTGYKVLVVDDILDTGETLSGLTDAIAEVCKGIQVAVAIENLEADFSAHWSGWEINRSENSDWFVFPWEEFI